MLKKLLVAVLACLTIFLSKRAMTESQLRPGPARQARATPGDGTRETRETQDAESGTTNRPMRTAAVF
ncbi:MAG TPA: hypothetical protein VM925_08015 [Labilithrix sp.]|nr:hypothetical protein [Labilithrix sp.]